MNLVSVSFGGGSQLSFAWSVGTAVAAGVILFLLNWWREWLTDRLKRTSEARVLAFTVSSQLDEFISQCSALVSRGFDFDPESGSVRDKAKPVKLSFSPNLPWSVLDMTLQHRIRSLPNEIDVIEHTLSSLWAEEDSDLLDVLEKREELYAQVGINAFNINLILHKQYGVPLLNRRHWRPEKIFENSLEKFAQFRDVVDTLKKHVELDELMPAASDEELRQRMSRLTLALQDAQKRLQAARSG